MRALTENRRVGKMRAITERAMRNPEFRPFLEAVKTLDKDDVDNFRIMTLAVCLENTKRWITKMVETSQTANIGSFPKHAYELITASLPTMTAHEAVNVQPLTSRHGQIFVMQYEYGTDKGSIRAGDTMFGAFKAGQGGESHYTSRTIWRERAGVGNGGTAVYDLTLEKVVIDAGSLTISALVGAVLVTLIDNGANVLLRGGVPAGAIDYTTGAVTGANFGGNVDNLAPILATYNVNLESNPENIGQVDFRITELPVQAFPRKVRARNTIDAAWEMQEIWGEDIDTNLIAVMGAGIAAESDAQIYGEIYDGAFDTIEPWDRDTPMGVSWVDHLRSFRGVANRGKNKIWQNTQKVRGNVMIAGIEVINVIEEQPDFKPVGKEENMAGPHLIGTWNGMKIIANPFYPVKEYVILYRGDAWIDVAYVYAPWMPLISTQPVTMDNFETYRGLATWFGTRMVNSRMIVKGSITGEPVPTPA